MAGKPKQTRTLPAPAELERICKGLAVLDAMMSAEWQDRYYSFNHAWSPKQRMASMRNGHGDDWFIVFAPAGVFVKAFWHEYPRGSANKIYKGLPPTFAAQRSEPAFDMDNITFGGWHDGTAWTLNGNIKPMLEELAMLSGDPQAYRSYAASYYEEALPLDAIAKVLAGDKLDAKLVKRLTKRTLASLESDLVEIGY